MIKLNKSVSIALNISIVLTVLLTVYLSYQYYIIITHDKSSTAAIVIFLIPMVVIPFFCILMLVSFCLINLYQFAQINVKKLSVSNRDIIVFVISLVVLIPIFITIYKTSDEIKNFIIELNTAYDEETSQPPRVGSSVMRSHPLTLNNEQLFEVGTVVNTFTCEKEHQFPVLLTYATVQKNKEEQRVTYDQPIQKCLDANEIFVLKY